MSDSLNDQPHLQDDRAAAQEPDAAAQREQQPDAAGVGRAPLRSPPLRSGSLRCGFTCSSRDAAAERNADQDPQPTLPWPRTARGRGRHRCGGGGRGGARVPAASGGARRRDGGNVAGTMAMRESAKACQPEGLARPAELASNRGVLERHKTFLFPQIRAGTFPCNRSFRRIPMRTSMRSLR